MNNVPEYKDSAKNEIQFVSRDGAQTSDCDQVTKPENAGDNCKPKLTSKPVGFWTQFFPDGAIVIKLKNSISAQTLYTQDSFAAAAAGFNPAPEAWMPGQGPYLNKSRLITQNTRSCRRFSILHSNLNNLFENKMNPKSYLFGPLIT